MSTQPTIDAPTACGMPEMPAPQQEHAWLRRFEGTWKTRAELNMVPDQPPMVATGIEEVRMLGGFWLVAETRSDTPEMPFQSILSLGYDPEGGHYTGTWIDTMTSRLWKYRGTVNAAGDTLTLETEGACPREPGKTRNFREVLQLVAPDHKVFTSSIQEDDGSWKTCVTVQARKQA